MSLRHAVPSLILCAAVFACQARAPGTQVALDTPIFVTAAGDTVALREELRIGQLDGPDEYTFSSVNWTTPTADGGVILYDLEGDDGYGENGRIRQFDAAGKFVRYIGRPGEGPGEYSPFPMGTVLRDGSLLIADQGLQRLTRYDTAGRDVMELAGPPAMVDLIRSTDGGWYAASVTGRSAGKPRQMEYVRYDSLGNEIGRFPAPDFYHDGPWGGIGAVDDPTTVVTLLPDGRAVSARNDSLLLVVSGAGDEVRVSAPHEPVAYLPEEAKARSAIFAARARRSGGSGAGVGIPTFKKVFSYVASDQDGRILVRLRTQGYKTDSEVPLQPNQTPWREPFALEVFDSTLTHRGRLIAPRSATRSGSSFTDDRAVWMVHEGDAGELYLVKWRSPTPIW